MKIFTATTVLIALTSVSCGGGLLRTLFVGEKPMREPLLPSSSSPPPPPVTALRPVDTPSAVTEAHSAGGGGRVVGETTGTLWDGNINAEQAPAIPAKNIVFSNWPTPNKVRVRFRAILILSLSFDCLQPLCCNGNPLLYYRKKTRRSQRPRSHAPVAALLPASPPARGHSTISTTQWIYLCFLSHQTRNPLT